jgi:hypothetical protein
MPTEIANEILPVVAGVACAVLVFRLVPPRWRLTVLAVLSVLVGVGASWVSGELSVSWGYVFFDIGQALVSGALTLAVIPAWQRRRRPAS